MNLNNMDSPPPSATFGQDASFRLDQPIGAMSISPSGRDVVLASKEGLHIIDLDSPYALPRHLPHRTPWEVADVQWSPFAVKDSWIVSTSNQKALVWNVAISGWRDAIEFVLHGHSRAITDINFSAHHPEILATCAVDTFVHAWDLRTPARPAFSFSDWFAGATQVKWSRQDEHIIASSHDKFLHIWDKRKGAYPARTIEAHGTKIYGIDWNRFEPTKIVTCSLDKTVKFWDTSTAEDVPERIIDTPFPVWRARHTPFGWGLLAMPQRGNNELHLYDRRPINDKFESGPVPPVRTFSGRKGQVREFLWRSRGTIKDGVDHRDFQLVSWGTDGELKLHSVHKETFKAIGYEQGVSRPIRLNFTRRNAKYRTFRDGVNEPYSPLENNSRTDSNQSHHQSLAPRVRQSTNVGMSRLSVTQFRGWLNGGKRERRTGMYGKSTVRQNLDPIAWMKSVKIVSWNADSLADEITNVGERFSKIEFELIDIGQRKIVMSLQGPWGDGGAVVYTRADFRFPRAYPKDAPAIVTIYKTSSISGEVYKTLSTEVHTIAETYASKQRGCIEAIVQYLSHEQSMEDIVEYLLDETTDAKMVPASDIAEDLSSDSDDDNLDSHQDPSNSSANLRVPLAKTCGALWSTTGELVCFFLPRPKESTSILGHFGDSEMADSQSNRLFEVFGRLQTNSPARRPGTGTQPTVDDAGSDVSDGISLFSESSSSSSSSSSDSELGLRDSFMPYGQNLNLGMRQRSRSTDGSNKSTTLDGTKAGEETRLNVVSIHYDAKDLLPAQKQLGEQYRICGPSSAICMHNAAVAESTNLPGAAPKASAWRLASLILQRRVPLNIMQSIDASEENITLIDRQLHRKDSGVDLSFDDQVESEQKGSVRWGSSPLGSRYLIAAIFNYFEKQADIQMLATLSCLFSEQQRGDYELEREGEHPHGPTSQYYHPSLEVADSMLRPRHGSNQRFTFAVTGPSIRAQLENNIRISPRKEPQHRRRNTASVAFKPDLSRQGEDGNREISIVVDTSSSGTTLAKAHATSMSTSPEDSRFSKRANSGIPFAASRASLNALAQSFQQSPPSNGSTAGSSLKKFSPSATPGWTGSIFGAAQNSRASRNSQAPSEANSDEGNPPLRGSSSFVTMQDLRRDSRNMRSSRGSLKNSYVVNNGKDVVPKKGRKRTIKTSLHNQDQFDLDGYSEVPLLKPELKFRYSMYRSAYAEQLGGWGLILQQAEFLQFDGGEVEIQHDWLRNTTKAQASVPKLEIAQCCIECGSTFAPIEKNGVPIGWHCTTISCHLSPEQRSKRQVCSICQEVVRGLSIPCLQCGHLTCYDCAQTWFSGRPYSDNVHGVEAYGTDDDDDDRDDLHKSCPSGCGCLCPLLQTINVPFPPKSDQEQDNRKRSQRLTPGTVVRHNSVHDTRSQRQKYDSSAPVFGPDTALGSMMALSRSRAASTTTSRTTATTIPESDCGNAGGAGDDGLSIDELVPWSAGKLTSLGRGIGGGLSRGLSNRSSDATIRKVG